MKLNMIADNLGSYQSKRRVGRGIGSGIGKTCGRGVKGQKARGKVARGFEGGQMPIYRRLPKRGFSKNCTNKYSILSLKKIMDAISLGLLDAKSAIDIDSLSMVGLIAHAGVKVKVLTPLEISISLRLRVHSCSASIVSAISNAGGVVELIED